MTMSKWLMLVLTSSVVLASACSRDDEDATRSATALTGSTFESTDANLAVNGGTGAKDWVNAPNLNVRLDRATGQGDDSFGQGSKEDSPLPTVVAGSIPNNKSDLTRFYVAREGNFVYLAWQRANTLGSANMDFEFNQSAVRSANGVTPIRTSGDILVTFDFVRGGSTPVLGMLTWITTGPSSQCYASNAVPCWGGRIDLSASALAEGAVNELQEVIDPIPPGAPRTLALNTFGEAALNVDLAGFFPPAPACKAIGSAFLKSRSSASFTAELKDFIAPALLEISNCAHSTIVLKKVDGAGSPLAGAVLQLFLDTNGNGVLDGTDRQIGADCTTGDDGLCNFDVGLNGTYIAHEVSAPAGYQKAPDQSRVVTLTRDPQTITLTFVNQRILLDLRKTVDKAAAFAGDYLVYTLSYANPGGASLTGLTLSDALPAKTTFQAITSSASLSCATPAVGATGNVTCAVGTLAAGASGTVTITVKLDSVFASTTNTVLNTATLTSDQTTPRSASASTTVTASPALTVAKTGPASAAPGSAINYTISVSNSGSTAATSVTVSDPSPAGVTLTGASSTAGTCGVTSGTVTCAIASLEAGASATVSVTGTLAGVFPSTTNTVHNVATVSSAQTGPREAFADTTVSAAPALAIIKGGPASASPGGTITYTITVNNSGSTAATSVAISDPSPTGVTLTSASSTAGTCGVASGIVSCNLASLAAGTSVTVTVMGTLAAVFPSTTNTVHNVATVSSAQTQAQQAVADTSVAAAPALAVTKSGPTSASPGSAITYTITVNNSGSTAATNVTISDPSPTGVSLTSAASTAGTCGVAAGTVNCVIASLAAGASATVTVAGAIAAVFPSTTNTLHNVVTVASAQTPPQQASADTTVLAAPALAITKSGPASASPGGAIAYTITVNNSGSTAATNVTISDPSPAGVTLTGASSTAGTCGVASGTVSCAIASLAAGASATITATGTLAAVFPSTTNTVHNVATVASAQTPQQQASADTTVLASPALAITKAGPASASPGGGITYTITVSNSGSTAATGVTISDPSPAGVTLTGASSTAGTCAVASGTVNCAIASLAAGASATITVAGTVAGVFPSTTNTVHNVATVASAETSPQQASADTTVLASPTLAITKAGPASASPGGAITYTITVSNSGSTAATSVTISDPSPAGVALTGASSTAGTCGITSGTVSCAIASLAAGASVTITATGTIAAVFPSTTNTLHNVATVASAETSPQQASADTAVLASPALAITKSGPASASPGGGITYTITVNNSGSTAATSVTISDPSPSGVTLTSASSTAGACGVASGTVSCAIASLAAGASATVTVTGTIAAVFPSTTNTVHNVATVASAETSPQQASADTTITAAPSFTFSKTAAVATSTTTVTNVASLTSAQGVGASTGEVVSSNVAQGAIITYTLTVTNGGSTGATSLVMTDPLPAGAAFCGASDGGTLVDGAATWTLDSLAVGGSATRTLVVRIGGGDCPAP